MTGTVTNDLIEAPREAIAREAPINESNGRQLCVNHLQLPRALYEAKLPASSAQIRAFYQAMDTNHDSGVDLDELLAFARRRRNAALDAIVGKGDDNGPFTTRCLPMLALPEGMALSDRDVLGIISRLHQDKIGSVAYQKFLNDLVLVPSFNPQDLFDQWFVQAFSEDGEYASAPRELHQKEGGSLFHTVVQKVAFGAAAGIISRTATAPFDRIRILIMTAKTRIGLVDAYRRAVSHSKGIRALWIGNGINCIKIAPEMGIKLFAFDTLKSAVAKDPDNVTAFERIIAGGCAGALAEFSVYPMEVLRTRLATGAYNGTLDAARAVYQSGGTGKFYAGIFPSIIGIIPFAAIDLTVNSLLKDLAAARSAKRGRQEVSVPLLLACGMTSSATAAVCTFPLNVIRTQAQATGRPILQIVKSLKAEGTRGFYRGIVPALMKVMPATSISYASYEYLNNHWHFNGQH